MCASVCVQGTAGGTHWGGADTSVRGVGGRVRWVWGCGSVGRRGAGGQRRGAQPPVVFLSPISHGWRPPLWRKAGEGWAHSDQKTSAEDSGQKTSVRGTRACQASGYAGCHTGGHRDMQPSFLPAPPKRPRRACRCHPLDGNASSGSRHHYRLLSGCPLPSQATARQRPSAPKSLGWRCRRRDPLPPCRRRGGRCRRPLCRRPLQTPIRFGNGRHVALQGRRHVPPQHQPWGVGEGRNHLVEYHLVHLCFHILPPLGVRVAPGGEAVVKRFCRAERAGGEGRQGGRLTRQAASASVAMHHAMARSGAHTVAHLCLTPLPREWEPSHPPRQQPSCAFSTVSVQSGRPALLLPSPIPRVPQTQQ